MHEVRRAVDFVERAKGFDPLSKLKLLLLFANKKPNTYLALKINPQNLEEKAHFEKHLKELGFLFSVGRAKAYEEITRVGGHTITWTIKGTWYGYDIFRTKKDKALFRTYVQRIKKRRFAEADRIAGKLYGYPSCCVEEFIKERSTAYVKKKYSCYEFYKKFHDAERNLPFITHSICSSKCTQVKKFNTIHRSVLKKIAPRFFKEYSAKKSLRSEVIIEGSSDIMQNGNSIWPTKNGYEYAVVSVKSHDGHHYLYSYLSKKQYERGSVLSAKIVMQYRYATITVGNIKKVIQNLHHKRKFVIPERGY